MPWIKDIRADMKERLVCGFSYLSMGMIGLIFYLLKGGKGVSTFFMFHFYQSILCGVFIMIFNWGRDALMNVLQGILGMIPGMPMAPLGYLNLGLTWVGQAMLLVLLYGAIFAFLGKLCDVPGISKLARMQMR